MLGKIRIETNGKLVAREWKIYLNDFDVSAMVQMIQVEAIVNEVPRVQLTIMGRLELPDELNAYVGVVLIAEETDELGEIEARGGKDRAGRLIQ